MQAGAEEIGAQPRPAPKHLPEFCLRADDLEEDEIDDLGHVDAGVEHVDGDGDVRGFLGPREIIDQGLGVLGLEIDHASERSLEMWIVLVKPLDDEGRVIVVLGEDDRLAEPVAVRDLQALGHQLFERLVDGVSVEQPFVDGGRLDLDGNVPVFVPLDRVPRLLLLLDSSS